MSGSLELLRLAALRLTLDPWPAAPAVGRLLDHEADRLERHIPAWTEPSRGVDNPPAGAWNNPERLAELIEHHYGPALAVAREYLRGKP